MKKMNVELIKNKTIALSIYLFCLSFFIVMQSPNNIWHNGDTGTDSTVFKYVAKEIMNGNMPYLDTFDHKGPLIYFINVVGNFIGLWKGIWVVEIVSMFVGLLFIYKIARLYCEWLMSSMLVFLVSGSIFKYFEGGNLVEEYAIPFIAIGTYIFLKYLDGYKLKRSEFVASGLAFACVLLLRPNMGVLWPIMCLGIFISLLKEHNIKEVKRVSKWFLVGMSLMLIPVLVWLVVKGALMPFIDSYFKYNMKYTEALSASNSRYTAISTYLSDSVVSIAAISTIVLMFAKRNIKNCLYVCFFFANILMVSMAGKISMHYGMIIVPSLIYPLAGIAAEIDAKPNDVRIGPSILLVLILVPYVWYSWMLGITTAIGQFSSRNQDYVSNVNREIANIVMQNTYQNDKITVCGNWNIIYLLSDRCSSSRYSYQTVCSIDEDMQDEYFEELTENPPSIIVLRNDFYPMEKMTAYLEQVSYDDIGGDNAGVARVLKRSRDN